MTFILAKEGLKHYKPIIPKLKTLNNQMLKFKIFESIFLPISLMRILKDNELYASYSNLLFKLRNEVYPVTISKTHNYF